MREKLTPNDRPPRPVSECCPCCGQMGPPEDEESHSARYGVRVTSYRVRPVDPDNLFAKWFVDALRYAGIIPDDRSVDIDYQITQEKVAKKIQEKTVIDVTHPA